MTIGEKLVALRKNSKLSQEKMAEKLGITRQTLSNYENDITTPDLNQAKNICEVLDISLDELIGNNKTLSSKISNTEKLVKKQTRNTKILLITIYLIIMTFLISFTIYMLTNKDFTHKYQVEFTCVNEDGDNPIIDFSLSASMIKLEYDDYIKIYEDDISADFYIEALIPTGSSKDVKSGNVLGKIYAGKSIDEAFNSVNTLKKVMAEQGYVCH